MESSVGGGNSGNANGEFAQIVRKFESSFIRVPFEQFRRSFRLEMKIAEKDLPALETLFKKHLNSDVNVPADNVIKALSERSRALHDKMMEYRLESKKFRSRFLKRIRWVEEQVSNGNYRTWSNGRLIRLIGDFLIRSGEPDSIIESIRKRKPELIEDFDLELNEMRKEILKSLKEKSLTNCLQWCADHRNNLKRIESDLEFMLRRQEFIELLRSGDYVAAIKISQKYFSNWLEGNYKEIREALSLICWLPFLGKEINWNNGLMKNYEKLLNPSQWKVLENQFEKDFVSVYQIDESSQLIKTVRTGLSVLKTRKCNPLLTETSECPACFGPLGTIAKDLPYGHFETTKIRCRITGKLMGEDDPPMALPNGQVYSELGLKQLSDGGNMIKCPVTGESFLISDARKCFFL